MVYPVIEENEERLRLAIETTQLGTWEWYPLTGELKKDPVCGTYTAIASSVQQTIRGQTFYFCSPQCRDKYVASLT